MMLRLQLVFVFMPLIALAGVPSNAAEPDHSARAFDRVQPLLMTRCGNCHGSDKPKGGLRLDSAEGLRRGGDSGPVVIPGDVDHSLLMLAVRGLRPKHPGKRMPPKEPLAEREIADLAEWVKEGAIWPEAGHGQVKGDPTIVTMVPASPGRGIGTAWTDKDNPIVTLFHGQRLDLWSLRKPLRPAEPTVKNLGWVRTPIDCFLLAKMEAKELTPSSEVDRRTLIRRLTFDLTGLPPTPEEVQAFVRDPASDAYDKLVERLLASSHYGERWGRHWLDVVRYADTNGFERDEFRPNTCRYRDYVIRSFNADKPYDQFVKEQLAGDEMIGPGEPRTADEIDKVIATGYMRLGQFDSTGSLFEEDSRGRDQLLADLANTTGSAFLGLTVACANCHDHKYDPISQADHFRLRAFFAGVKFRDDIRVDLPAPREEIDLSNGAIDGQIEAVEKEIANLLQTAKRKIADERRAAFPGDIKAVLKTEESKWDNYTRKKLKPFLEKLKVSDEDAGKALSEADRKQSDGLRQRINGLKGQKQPQAMALAMTDSGTTAPPTRVLFQGDYQQPKQEVAPGFLSVLDPNPAVITAPESHASTGRRTALAGWITSPDNPLTARVMVNRIWQHHFGSGLVATPNDFGYSGARPKNQELLDWLATEFVRSGWSVKHMQRLIVRSAAYRQVSFNDPARRHIDPDNALLWRQNMQRHEAETLRDSMLAVSGLLLPVGGGPPRWPPVPQELLDGQPSILETHSDEAAAKRLEGWYTDPVETTDVRTLFLVQKRILPVPFLQAFDLQDMMLSCPARGTTTVAPQALTLLNSDLTIRAARAFAKRVAAEAGNNPEQQVRRAVWLALSREPDETEMSIALNLLKKHGQSHGSEVESPAQAALTDLCRMLMNVNEFVYVD